MRGMIKNKLFAAAVTMAFMAVVRPDPEPELWGVAMVAIMMYEFIFYAIEYIGREIREREREYRIEVNEIARKKDGRRWANEWIA